MNNNENVVKSVLNKIKLPFYFISELEIGYLRILSYKWLLNYYVQILQTDESHLASPAIKRPLYLYSEYLHFVVVVVAALDSGDW